MANDPWGFLSLEKIQDSSGGLRAYTPTIYKNTRNADEL
jgi:hypothetical protein